MMPLPHRSAISSPGGLQAILVVRVHTGIAFFTAMGFRLSIEPDAGRESHGLFTATGAFVQVGIENVIVPSEQGKVLAVAGLQLACLLAVDDHLWRAAIEAFQYVIFQIDRDDGYASITTCRPAGKRLEVAPSPTNRG